MGKVITVWGSPGSGKSMFCCILAKALTRDKRKAIIINADMNVPMLPVWLPEQIIQTNTSIGQVLSSVEIDTSLVASHVTVLKNYPFIGMMGYAAGENPLSYPEVKYTMVLQLIHAAAKLVDFVILDCSTSMTNVFTPAAIEAGDVVIRILTPDLKGINYLKAHQPLLVDELFRFSEHMTFAGLARPFHALDEMGYIIGGFDGLLPYSKEIDRCATEGGMFKAITYCNLASPMSLAQVPDIPRSFAGILWAILLLPYFCRFPYYFSARSFLRSHLRKVPVFPPSSAKNPLQNSPEIKTLPLPASADDCSRR